MAEILGVVVSGISVVQIAGQLLGRVKQVRSFLQMDTEYTRRFAIYAQ
jgi:hypothetical protein